MAGRDYFWFAAGLMAAVAALFVLTPLVRRWPDRAPAPVRHGLLLGVAVLAGLALGALALYAWVGSPAALDASGPATSGQPQELTTGVPAAPVAAPSMTEVTAKLAARLAAEGGTPEDWRLLAQSYDYLGQAELAAAARQRANGVVDNAQPAATTSGAARIEGTVDLAPALQGRDSSGATLFIYAKEVGAAGPPLAVLRIVAGQWPVKFVLDDSNAMVPDRNLSSVNAVLIEARVSRSGDATPHTGDLVGTTSGVDPRAGKPVSITIARVVD